MPRATFYFGLGPHIKIKTLILMGMSSFFDMNWCKCLFQTGIMSIRPWDMDLSGACTCDFKGFN